MEAFLHSKLPSKPQKAAQPAKTGAGRGALQAAADRSPATNRLAALNGMARQSRHSVTQRVWTGAIDASTKDGDIIQALDELGYDTSKLRPWKIAELRKSSTEYASYEAVALALSVSKTSGDAASGTKTETVTAVAPDVVAKSPELSSVATIDVPVPDVPGPSAPKPVVPSGKAHKVVSSVMAAVAKRANAEKSGGSKAKRPPMIDTGRVKIYAPEGDQLVVYRAEKTSRNSLADREAQGGLVPWKPSSSSAKEAYERMFQIITGGETLGEFAFKAALNSYAQKLRAQGQHDNLASARTVEGAFVDDFNYTITVPNVRLFKWTPSGIGERIPPGAEIKQHYIVLDADTIDASSIFGIGHVTGTQEVSFYSKIPADMITSVQEGSFNAAKKSFKKLDTPAD